MSTSSSTSASLIRSWPRVIGGAVVVALAVIGAFTVLVTIYLGLGGDVAAAPVTAPEPAVEAVGDGEMGSALAVMPSGTDGVLNLVWDQQVVGTVAWPSPEPCEDTLKLPMLSAASGNVAGSIEMCSGK